MLQSEIFTIEDCLYAPKLDGTETLHQITGTTTISDGVMSGGCGYIGTFDNTGDWILTVDVKHESNANGLMLIKNGETQRDKNNATFDNSNRCWYYTNGSRNNTPQLSGLSNTWYSYEIKKQGTSMTYKVNGQTSNSFSWGVANNESVLCIGVDTWGSVTSIKNIKVKPL